MRIEINILNHGHRRDKHQNNRTFKSITLKKTVMAKMVKYSYLGFEILLIYCWKISFARSPFSTVIVPLCCRYDTLISC